MRHIEFRHQSLTSASLAHLQTLSHRVPLNLACKETAEKAVPSTYHVLNCLSLNILGRVMGKATLLRVVEKHSLVSHSEQNRRQSVLSSRRVSCVLSQVRQHELDQALIRVKVA